MPSCVRAKYHYISFTVLLNLAMSHNFIAPYLNVNNNNDEHVDDGRSSRLV